MTTLEQRWQPGADKTTALARMVDEIGRDTGYGDQQLTWFDLDPTDVEPQPEDFQPQPKRTGPDRAADGPVLNPEDFWETPAADSPTGQPWRSRFAEPEQKQDRWRNRFADEADQQREPDQEHEQRRGRWRNRFATRSRGRNPDHDLGLGL